MKTLTKTKPSAPVVLFPEEPVQSQFDQLPEEYQEVCEEEALPLEYVGEDWRSLLVTTNSVMHESGLIGGAALRDRWETSNLEKMGLSSVKAMKGGWLPVRCPDGRYLAIKILDEAI